METSPAIKLLKNQTNNTAICSSLANEIEQKCWKSLQHKKINKTNSNLNNYFTQLHTVKYTKRKVTF